MESVKDYVSISKKEIRSCKHKAENRWYRRLFIINLILVIGVISLFCFNFDKNLNNLDKEITKFEEFINSPSGQAIPSVGDNLPLEIQGMIIIIAMIVAFPIGINILYAQNRSSAIRITEKNFPEVHERIIEYSHRLGLKKVPEAYILQENGLLNAFSAFIFRKQYLQINADLFEIAYREHKDIESLSFIIAHELSHIKLKHATFWYNLGIIFSSPLPILGSTASRAREYSCDRLAQKVTGYDGINAILSLMAGKHLYKAVDVEDYIENAKNVKGFFVWCCNLLATHPTMPKRIMALIETDKSGKLY